MGDTYSTRHRSSSGGVSSASRPSMAWRKAASVLPDPVGAWMSVWAPEAIAGHPSSWAWVGPANEASNQAFVAGENIDGAYRLAVTRIWASQTRSQRRARAELDRARAGSEGLESIPRGNGSDLR